METWCQREEFLKHASISSAMSPSFTTGKFCLLPLRLIDQKRWDLVIESREKIQLPHLSSCVSFAPSTLKSPQTKEGEDADQEGEEEGEEEFSLANSDYVEDEDAAILGIAFLPNCTPPDNQLTPLVTSANGNSWRNNSSCNLILTSLVCQCQSNEECLSVPLGGQYEGTVVPNDSSSSQRSVYRFIHMSLLVSEFLLILLELVAALLGRKTTSGKEERKRLDHWQRMHNDNWQRGGPTSFGDLLTVEGVLL
jgi:hypothetical protein